MDPVGVIFDMDGVLVDSGPWHLESWRRLAMEHAGQTISEARFARSFGQRSAEIIEAWFGVTDPEMVRRLDGRKEAIYRELIRGRVPAMPGAMEILQELRRSEIRVAIGSSGPAENVSLVCAEMGLDRMVDAVVTGADVQAGKPDPSVFLLAASRLGVEPRRCVVIEDAWSGVEAAKRAGMRCVALAADPPRPGLELADLRVCGLRELSAARIRDLLGPS
jgi:beta-phosphoglucomutase